MAETDTTRSHEVDANEALLEETGADQAPGGDLDEEQLEPLDHGDVLDVLEPKTKARVQEIGPDEDRRAYVQRELSPLSKMQLFGLVGDVMDKALTGENAMSVGHLFEVPGDRDKELRLEDFKEADTFVQAVAKLVKYSPTFITDAFIILLGVEDDQEDFFRLYMKKNATDGGLTDDDFTDIIETFIDQNWAAIDVFFREKMARIRKRAQKQIETKGSKRGQSSASSTRSRTTQQRTAASQ